MLKLASLALIPMLATVFLPEDPNKTTQMWNYARSNPEDLDRHFLEALNETAPSEEERKLAAAKDADFAFLTALEEEDRIPVRRAIPVERPVSVDPLAEAEREGIEVRRAIPVSRTVALGSEMNRRSALQRSYVTLIEQEPEVRRALPVNRKRPSISIYGEEVVVRSKVPSLP